jgi:hypothetical protein
MVQLGRYLTIGAGGFSIGIRNTDTGATHNISGLLVQGTAGLGRATPMVMNGTVDQPTTGLTRILQGPACGKEVTADSFNGWAIIRGLDARALVGGTVNVIYFTRWYDVAMAIPLSRGVGGIPAADFILSRATKALCFVAGIDGETSLGIGMSAGRFICRVH